MSSISASRKRRSDTRMVTSTIRNDSSNNNDENANTDTAAALSAVPAPHATTLRVHLKQFHGVAAWSWNANDDVCGICQSAFEGTAPGVKYPGEDCPVVWGNCGHAFHLQCVSKWLQSANSKNSCPICRQAWEFGQNPISNNNTSGTNDNE